MSKLKIANNTGLTNDTIISIDDIQLDCVTEITIKPLKPNKLIIADVTIDLTLLNIETKEFVFNAVYGEKDFCTPNCKGCESGIPSIQGCR